MRNICLAACAVTIFATAGCANAPRPVPLGSAPQSFTPPTDFVAAAQIVIKPTFDRQPVTRESIAQEVQRCSPQFIVLGEMKRRLEEDFGKPNAVSELRNPRTSKVFTFNNIHAICLESSEHGRPIFAAEMFNGTATAQGVPPDILEAWHQQLAYTLAIKGRVKAMYAFANGNAYEVSYWTEDSSKTALSYFGAFKKAGEWEATVVDHKFSHEAMSGFSISKFGKGQQMTKRLLVDERR